VALRPQPPDLVHQLLVVHANLVPDRADDNPLSAAMATEKRKRLDQRVAATAEAVLAERGHVTAIDVLVALGWLTPRRVDEWRQGRVDYLERVVQANLSKVSAAMKAFRAWARGRGLKPQRDRLRRPNARSPSAAVLQER
jgi:hypothetical protein